MNSWLRRIGVYVLGVFLGLLLVSRLPSRHEVKVSDFQASFDHQQLARSQWVNVSHQLSADDLAGRMILLFFVGPDCEVCAGLTPELQSWQQRFGTDLLVLPVWEASIPVRLPAAFDLLPTVLDSTQVIAGYFAVQHTPAFALLRPDGQRLAVYTAEDSAKILADLAYLHQLFLHKMKNSPLN